MAAGDYVNGARELLSAARTYYVDTTGSDSNDGLTAGTPFLTINKAINIVSALDLSAYSVTIQLADGAYTSTATLKSLVGTGTVTIRGNTTTPANTLISVTGANAISAVSVNGSWALKSVKISTTTSGACVYAYGAPTTVNIDAVDFGACAGAHIQAQFGGRVNVSTGYTISGGAQQHVYALQAGIFNAYAKTVVLTGTPGFSGAFCKAISGIAYVVGCTFSGGATGKRYDCSLNGVVMVNGAGATYLPGDVAGTTETGGQYA